MIAKNILIAAIACAMPTIASAEAWIVDVTLSYMDSQLKLVQNEPVLSFTVPVGECVKGLSRTEDMIPQPMRVTQEICVSKSGETTKIRGWIFSKERITNLAFKDERGAAIRGNLNYGQPINAEIHGDFVKFTSGHYTLSATRTMSSGL